MASEAGCTQHRLTREGVELAALDWGRGQPSVLLLHGLAGYAGEWIDTTARLASRCRLVALDVRGHGRSQPSPDDLSAQALIDDAVFAAEELDLAPVIVVGQSIGGVIAMLVAAQRPDLIRGLVLVEAGPASSTEQERREVIDYLRSWPTPFSDEAAARSFFIGSDLYSKRWAGGLSQEDGVLQPRFDVEVLSELLREITARSHWSEWASIQCPILVVGASSGSLGQAELARMRATNGNARFHRIERAGHDLHLDANDEWAELLGGFVADCD